MPQLPVKIPAAQQSHGIGHNDGPPLETPSPPSRRWGRLPRFCDNYEIETTTAYGWLGAGRVRSRKIGGIRLWEIGTVRGVDNDEPPEPRWAIPAAARPENEGRHYGHRRREPSR